LVWRRVAILSAGLFDAARRDPAAKGGLKEPDDPLRRTYHF
jgi:hypothetical protein